MINRNDLCAGTRPEVGHRVLVTEKETFEYLRSVPNDSEY